MDIRRALRNAVSTGTVFIGTDQTLKSLKKGKSKLIIVCSNCHGDTLEQIKGFESTPIYSFEGTNQDLGSACGKPFPISVLSIIDGGESDILLLRKEASSGKKKILKKKKVKTT